MKKIDLQRAPDSRQKEHLFITIAFLIKASQVEAGIMLGWRVFTFNSKTETKRILGKKGMLKIQGSGFVKYELKGLSEYCLNQASQFLDENDILYS